ncbi:hypothetical protein [Glycomyces sp. MUSA5-2]|uniref:hypothetical protein n=1 Tax=Glycomyces sp. MUSA5-2 TaxID=2053002 RepID=UPI00300BB562
MSCGEGRVAKLVVEQVFERRAELIHEIDLQNPEASAVDPAEADPEGSESGLRAVTAHRLHEETEGMNRENFVVRRHRRGVERFAEFQAWSWPLDRGALEAFYEIAGLPTGYRPKEDRSQETRRFDLLSLRFHLTLLKHEPGFDRLRDQASEAALLLLDQLSIPAVAAQHDLLEAVGGNEWWVDVTVPMLERMRHRLRGLVCLIDKFRTKIRA